MDARELLEELILAIVDDHEAIRVTDISDKGQPDIRVLHVDVAPRDRGKVIGRDGVIALSLRHLFGIIGQKAQQQIEVQINGGQNRQQRPRPDFRSQQHQPQFPPGTQMMMVPVPPGFVASNGPDNFRRRPPGRFGGRY
jgi:predicted RNA-binding protein YlqC (UPF0109 family)